MRLRIEAEQWRAAAQGHAEAQNSIGYACETGATGETNVVEAYMWYQLAVIEYFGNEVRNPLVHAVLHLKRHARAY